MEIIWYHWIVLRVDKQHGEVTYSIHQLPARHPPVQIQDTLKPHHPASVMLIQLLYAAHRPQLSLIGELNFCRVQRISVTVMPPMLYLTVDAPTLLPLKQAIAMSSQQLQLALCNSSIVDSA